LGSSRDDWKTTAADYANFADQIREIRVIRGSFLTQMTIQEKIQVQMTEAMRNKDQLRLGVLRMMKTAIKNKEIEKMKPLDDG
jgi:hypothetical protein